MIEIEIDGNKIAAAPNTMVIEVADDNGIEIPRFCYHKKLSVVANCRMCLVEIENSPKPMPACATPITSGMKVFTKSEKAIAAQKNVMEFLLINHPLDCPICDQGGECDLQDLAVAYGNDYSRFTEPKRIVKDKNLGALISTDMTRCIHCTRCVRFGKEISGVVELGGLGRGEHMEIGTYVEQSLISELSGNIIDLCPVGALTSKPFRYQARNWELKNTQSIAPHDALGSNVILQSINNKIIRVLPDENEAINEVWLSDRDRFSYLGLYTKDRLQEPMMRNKEGGLEIVTWAKALGVVGAKFIEILGKNDANCLGVAMSPNSSVEEFYLANKILQSVNSNNITYKLRHLNKANIVSSMTCKIAEIEQMESVLIIGSKINHEVPLIAHRLNKAYKNGAEVNIINQTKTDFVFVASSQTKSVDEMRSRLEGVKQILLGESSDDQIAKKIANSLKKSKKSLIILGQSVCVSSECASVYSLVNEISQLAKTELLVIDIGANSSGAKFAGISADKTLEQIIENSKGLVLFNTELVVDSNKDLKDKLKQVDFVVAISSYFSEELKDYADLILPLASFGETSGTFVNVENNWQSFAGAVAPLGDSRPGWKILRVLANYLELMGFEFVNSQQVLQECKDNLVTPATNLDQVKRINPENLQVTVAPIYQGDALVRRSQALQDTGIGAR